MFSTELKSVSVYLKTVFLIVELIRDIELEHPVMLLHSPVLTVTRQIVVWSVCLCNPNSDL